MNLHFFIPRCIGQALLQRYKQHKEFTEKFYFKWIQKCRTWLLSWYNFDHVFVIHSIIIKPQIKTALDKKADPQLDAASKHREGVITIYR